MANEKKAVCGGFLIGDGLQMDGKVLSASGGNDEPVDVTFDFVSFISFIDAKFEINNYVEGKPIRFESGYWGGSITCYPIEKIDYDGEDVEYRYHDVTSNVVLEISKAANGKWYAVEKWTHKVGFYDSSNSKFEIETILDPINYRIELTGIKTGTYDYINYIGVPYNIHVLQRNTASQYSCLVSNNDGTALKRICLIISGSTVTVTEKEIQLT